MLCGCVCVLENYNYWEMFVCFCSAISQSYLFAAHSQTM